MARFILVLQGGGDEDLAQQILPAQELARGGDFVAFGLSHHTAQKASLGIHCIDDLHSAVAHFLAVDDDDPIFPGSQDLILPTQEHPLHQIVIQLMQHTGEGGFLGPARFAGVRVGSKFKARN